MHRPLSSASLLLAVLFVSLLPAAPAQAQDLTPHARPQDVFLTDLVYPQERGEVQLSLTPGLPELSDRRGLEAPLVVEYGLTDAWQLEAAWSRPPLAAEASHTFELGTQYSWLHLGGSRLHAALGVEAEWSEGALEGVVPSLTVATDAGGLHVFAQGFATLGGDEEASAEEEAGDWGVQGGTFFSVGGLILSTELGWGHTDTGSRYALAPGMLIPLPGGWEVGAGLPLWLHDGDTAAGLTALLTYEFALNGDED